MVRVYSCLAQEHDLWLVLLAGLICTFASFTAFTLVGRARAATGWARRGWLSTAAIATGFSIWTTHFVAMLAYDAGLPIAYDFGLTVASALMAVVVTGAGLGLHVALSSASGAWLAGAIVGLGVAAMHYTGMAAIRLPGRLAYDPTLVATSIALGIGFAVAALRRDAPGGGARRLLQAASLLTLSICALHFTGMGGVTVVFDPTVPFEETGFSRDVLIISVASATFIILALSLVGALVDRHLASRAVQEAERLQTLADASAEAIVITRDGKILDANHLFARMAGKSLASLRSQHLPAIIGSETYEAALSRAAAGEQAAPYEATISLNGGDQIPVEIFIRSIDFDGSACDIFTIRDISERRKSEARIQFLAHYDDLTQLPNRSSFNDHLQRELARARRHDQQLALLCLDLDRFKEINDIFGHHMGDNLLKGVAARLLKTTRDTDIVSRLGGDEFVILQVGIEQPMGAQALAERLMQEFKQVFEFEGQDILTACTIGISLYPSDGTDPGTLLRNADTALYRAKAEGRGSYRFFEPSMDKQLRERRILDLELRQALIRDQIYLHYQPQVNLNAAELVGFECLARWRHHEMGEIPPSVFIPLAEESGFIIQLGLWVLQQACAEAAKWQRPLNIAVNLSPVQFQQGDIVKAIREILNDTGLAPQRLELEITEGVLLRDKERATAILQELKALGIRIAMDDFGTGYSSLSYLQSFPFDKIKIDSSFVSGLAENEDARAIVQAIVGLGRGLKMPVVAEGVETEAQLAILRGEFCDEIQGYLVSKPCAISQFADILHSDASWEDLKRIMGSIEKQAAE